MFNKIFNLEVKEAKERKSIVYKPAIAMKKPQPVKPDALKRLEKILDDVQNLNNPKVDTLRKLFIHLQSENTNATDLMAYLKQPITKPKKKATIKLNKI